MSGDAKHSKYAPSGSHQWINCPASIQEEAKYPKQKESEYAAEGTAAHELGAKCLTEGKEPKDFLGAEFYGFKVSQEMADAVTVYTEEVWSHAEEINPAQGDVYLVEQKLDLSWLHPGMFGSSDAVLYKANKKTLKVFDYKHGVGVPVDIEWNSQLMIYGVGALYRLWQKYVQRTGKVVNAIQLVETVELYIVQPRLYGDEPVKCWTIPAKELVWWALHVLKPAAVACDEKQPRFNAGDHCRWCNAKPGCSTFAKYTTALAQTKFENPVLPPVEQLTADQIGEIISKAELFKAWVDSVKDYAEHRLMQGEQIPGLKLVAKKSNRKWRDEKEAQDTLVKLLGHAAFESKLLTVAKAEKALKKTGVSIEDLWEKPDAGLTMVKDSDRRQALPSPAAAAFQDESAGMFN